MKRRSSSINSETSTDTPPATLKSLYTMMLRIRKFEEKVADLLLCSSPEIICPVHLYTGQEAVAAGVCANLRKDDYVFSTHRSHGHYLAKGGDMNALMAELFGKETGCSKGRGGSMHLASPDVGLPGSSAIVAGTIPLAVGAALAFATQKTDAVAVTFFGDGATNEGVFYEALNFASLKKLPVIFVCENNLYSTHMSISDCLADTDIHKKAEAFNMPGIRIDGNNVSEVLQSSNRIIQDARSGRGPALLECMTYRWRGHVGPNYDLEKGLRSQEELDYWINKDPIKTSRELLLERHIVSEPELISLGVSIDKEIDEALTFARESPYPNENALLDNVYKS